MTNYKTYKTGKTQKQKPDRGFLNEQMPTYSEASSTSYVKKGAFINQGRPPIKRPWTKMVKKGY